MRKNKALCFTGHDKNPSLSFETRRNFFHCFGCGISGSPIDLVQGVLNLSALDAARWLTGHATGDKYVPQTAQHAIRQDNIREPGPQIAIDSDVYEYALDHCTPLRQSGLSYLRTQRGFSENMIRRFRIGQLDSAPATYRRLVARWGLDRLIACGLAVRRIYDGREAGSLVWWDSGLIFPALEHGRVTYLQLRRLKGNAPKYVGLSAIPKPLFNSDILNRLAPGDRVCICEGIPDTVAAVQLGWNAVGVLGAASFRPDWVQRFLPFTVLVAPDGDAAGEGLYKSVVANFRQYGRNVERLLIRPGQDFNSLLIARQGQEFK